MQRLLLGFILFLLPVAASADYAADWTAAHDGGVRVKVTMAAHSAAIDILGEGASGKDLKDQKRQELAYRVLSTWNDDILERFAVAAVADGSITGASSDAQVKTRLSALWDDLAGVPTKER